MKMALDRILVGERLRPVIPARVAVLSESMEAKGLDQPIVVRTLATAVGAQDHQLVIGAHRLAAAGALGWMDIEALIRPYDETTARLAEIDENLVRGELSPLDRCICLAERKRIWEELHPEARHGGDRRSKTRPRSNGKELPLDRVAGFSREAAATIGLSDRTIRDAVQIAEALSGDIADFLRRAPVELKGAQLRALARLPATERRTAAAHLSDGRAPSFDAALAAVGRKAPPVDGQEQLYRALVSLWGRTSAKTRKRFLAHIGEGRP